MSKLSFGMLVFPNMTNLDFAGPYEFFAKLPIAETHILWKTREPIRTETGLSIAATKSLDDCPPLDLVFVPGGPGQIDLMDDQVVLDFLARTAVGAKWITAVCTGSLVLGAAGLLRGYRATSHWMSVDQLALFGATPSHDRVVVDRNRITGGGVTAGIDFGLKILALAGGDEMAQRFQLGLEYDPQPPFNAGSPRSAPAHLVAQVRERAAPLIARRLKSSQAAAERLTAAGVI